MNPVEKILGNNELNDCPICQGTGIVGSGECHFCSGTGKTKGWEPNYP